MNAKSNLIVAMALWLGAAALIGDAVAQQSRYSSGWRDPSAQAPPQAAGELAVSIDGKEVMRITDRGFRDSLDGFVLVNRGGEYTVRSVAIYGK